MGVISYDGTINTGNIAPRTLNDRIGANYGIAAIRQRANAAKQLGEAGANLGKTIEHIGNQLVSVAKNEMDKDFAIDEATAKANFAQGQMELAHALENTTFASADEYNKAATDGFEIDDGNGGKKRIKGLNELIKNNFGEKFRNAFAYGHRIEKAALAARSSADLITTKIWQNKADAERTSRINALVNTSIAIGDLNGAFNAIDKLPNISAEERGFKKATAINKYGTDQVNRFIDDAQLSYNAEQASSILFANTRNSTDWKNYSTATIENIREQKNNAREAIKNLKKPQGVDDRMWERMQRDLFTYNEKSFARVEENALRSLEYVENKAAKDDLQEYKDFKSGKVPILSRAGAIELDNFTRKKTAEEMAKVNAETSRQLAIYHKSPSVYDEINKLDPKNFETKTFQERHDKVFKEAERIVDTVFDNPAYFKGDTDDEIAVEKAEMAQKIYTSIEQTLAAKEQAQEKAGEGKTQSQKQAKLQEEQKAEEERQKEIAFLLSNLTQEDLDAFRKAQSPATPDGSQLVVKYDISGNNDIIQAGGWFSDDKLLATKNELTIDDFKNDIYQACVAYPKDTAANTTKRQNAIFATLKTAMMVLDEEDFASLQKIAVECLDDSRQAVPKETVIEMTRNAFLQAFDKGKGEDKWKDLYSDEDDFPQEFAALYNQEIETLSKVKSFDALKASTEALRARLVEMRASKDSASAAIAYAERLLNANDTGGRIFATPVKDVRKTVKVPPRQEKLDFSPYIDEKHLLSDEPLLLKAGRIFDQYPADVQTVSINKELKEFDERQKHRQEIYDKEQQEQKEIIEERKRWEEVLLKKLLEEEKDKEIRRKLQDLIFIRNARKRKRSKG